MAIELDKDLALTMTPEELEAINAEPSPEEHLIMRQQAAADADDGADDKGESEEKSEDGKGAPPVEGAADTSAAEADPAADAAAGAAQAADKESNGADADAAAAKAEEPDDAKPQFSAKLPADFDERFSAVNDGIKALAGKYKDGTLDFDEYNDQLQALTAQRDELNAAKIKVDILNEVNAQTATQDNERTAKVFMRDVAKADGIDYRTDDAKRSDLMMFAERLEIEPDNAGKTLEWLLAEAHKRVKLLYGIASPAKQPDTVKDPVKAAKEERKAPVAAIPKTLAQVPGGEGPGDVSAEFSDLDALDGMELETAIARMTPAQRERYAQAT